MQTTGQWYFPANKAAAVLSFLVNEGRKIGFKLNLSKTQVWWWSTPYIPHFPAAVSTERVLKVLGSVIGEDTAFKAQLATKLGKADHMFAQLTALNDPHLAYTLLYFCAGPCKMIHIVRSTPPHLTKALAITFDQKQRGAFETIHRSLSNAAWQQACFPFHRGGIGLTPLTWINDAAYISSFLAVWSLMDRTVSSALNSISLTAGHRRSLTKIAQALKV